VAMVACTAFGKRKEGLDLGCSGLGIAGARTFGGVIGGVVVVHVVMDVRARSVPSSASVGPSWLVRA
jgi:hypothetical protein